MYARLVLASVVLSVAAAVPPQAAAAAAGGVIPPGVLPAAITTNRVVALTFDDGPTVPYTGEILDILRRYSVPATFNLVGTQVSLYPGLVAKEARAGEELANHTYNHADLQNLSTPGVIAQLARDEAVIRSASGITTHWMRPPYGNVDDRIVQISASLGLHVETWSIDSEDWTLPGKKAILADVLNYAQPGSVIIMHDGGGDRSETVAALPALIKSLKRLHFRFGTLDQVFGVQPLPPCVPDAGARFAAAGIQPDISNAIFKAWRGLLCYATNYGPATSSVYRLPNGDEAQDFRRTARRLEVLTDGSVHATIMWSWAAAVFSRNGTNPRYGTPLTKAWFHDYLEGVNRGPAQGSPRKLGHLLVQRFARGWAVQTPSRVLWSKSLSPFRKRKP